jgi:hypothetical protein
MLGRSSWVAAHLATSQEGLGSVNKSCPFVSQIFLLLVIVKHRVFIIIFHSYHYKYKRSKWQGGPQTLLFAVWRPVSTPGTAMKMVPPERVRVLLKKQTITHVFSLRRSHGVCINNFVENLTEMVLKLWEYAGQVRKKWWDFHSWQLQ